MMKSEAWFNDAALDAIYARYGLQFPLSRISYSTVQDYCNSFDHLNPLATASADLKDVQRPWMLKAILGTVPRGGRLIEIGAGEPWVADLLARLGYEVWVIDPYDGSGNGPRDFEVFSAQCPLVRFIREPFTDRLSGLPLQSFDCVYSISVLEHIPAPALKEVAAGIKSFLRDGGCTLHAVDHVHRGNGAREHLSGLEMMTSLFGLSPLALKECLQRVDHDSEPYFLSAEGHNRWRGNTPYHQFPMRVCISLQLVSDTGLLMQATN